MGIKETLLFILSPQHLPLYLKLFFVLAVLALNGITIFSLIFKTENKLIITGGGMILGPLGFLLILSVLSYFLKGHQAIKILFGIYTLACFIFILKNTFSIKRLLYIDKSVKSLTVIAVVLFYVIIFFFYGRSAPIGGDVSTYWGIATSFARGNYPTVLPWQAKFLSAYHEGSFVIMGAISALSSVNIWIVHLFFSIYLVTALLIIVTGINREKDLSFLALLPAILGIILFGGPILFIGNIGNFLSRLINLDINYFIQFDNLKSSIGSSAASIGGMYYSNFYTFGLASLFLFLYIYFETKNKKLMLQNILLTILSILILSISESLFILLVPFLAIKLVKDYILNNFNKNIRHLYILFFLFISLFLLVQNFIRDSLISPGTQGTSFRILTPRDTVFHDRIKYMKEVRFISKDGSIWYLPDLRLTILLTFIFAFIFKSKWAIIMATLSLISLFFSVVIVDPFWPASGLRFTNQSHQMILFAYGFLIVDLLRNRKNTIAFITGLLMVIFILPQFIGNNFVFIHRSLTRDDGYLIKNADLKVEHLIWINNNLEYKKNILFVDEYPFNGPNSPMTDCAVQNYGIFVPTGPPNVKLISVDTSLTWYDAIVFLNSRALKDLKVDYVFIKHSEVGRFSAKRQNQIKNKEYFKPVYEDITGILYEVKPDFKDLEDEETTLQKMVDTIGDGDIVYLDTFSVVDIRKGLIAELANRVKLIGPRYRLGYDYFLYVAAILPFTPTDYPNSNKEVKELKSIDYVFTTPLRNPNEFLTGKYNKKYEIQQVSFWEKEK